MLSTRILSPERVARTLDRLAHEVVERNRGGEDMVVVGILRRGADLAEALAGQIAQIVGHDIPCYGLDVRPYRDDGDTVPPPGRDGRIHVADRHVLLVDDVLHTGRTARAALDAIVHHGRPRSIQLAVLVDRGGREYPIEATYFGRVLPAKPGERIVVANAAGGFAIDRRHA